MRAALGVILVADTEFTIACPVANFSHNVHVGLCDAFEQIREHLSSIGYVLTIILIGICELSENAISPIAHLQISEYLQKIDDAYNYDLVGKLEYQHRVTTNYLHHFNHFQGAINDIALIRGYLNLE